MAYMRVEQGYSLLNFLESAIGLVQKTKMVTQEVATTVDNKRLIYAGTAFPSNDSRATGIVSETVGMTDNINRSASVIKAGRIYGNRLKISLSSEVKTVSKKKEFVILDAPECEFQLEV